MGWVATGAATAADGAAAVAAAVTGEATATALGPGGGLRALGEARVRGRATPTRIFTLE